MESNGHRSWMLPVYFLASSFNGAMKKLEESLQLLQKNEASCASGASSAPTTRTWPVIS